VDDTGFLVRPSATLFVVLHRPADRPPSGSLTVCISLADEGHVDVMGITVAAGFLAGSML
jgi:hypothetical protein